MDIDIDEIYIYIWNLSRWVNPRLTQYPKFQWENKAKEDYKPEKTGPGQEIMVVAKNILPSLRELLRISYS